MSKNSIAPCLACGGKTKYVKDLKGDRCFVVRCRKCRWHGVVMPSKLYNRYKEIEENE